MTTAKARDTLEVVSIVTGLAMSGWLVWMLLPGSAQDAIKAHTISHLTRYARGRRLAAERHQVVRQMEFEVWTATQALMDYDGHHDGSQLARDLETVATSA
jgi:hypothetical protein